MAHYDIPGTYGSPHSVIEGSDGKLWFTLEVNGGRIGKYDPAAASPNNFTIYNVGGSPGALTIGPANSLWFTSYDGTIGKIDQNGQYAFYDIPAYTGGGSPIDYTPRDITTGPDGRLWVSAASSGGGAPSKIFRLNTNGTVHSSYIINNAPLSVVSDPANNVVWYGQSDHTGQTNRVGRIDMAGNKVEQSLPANLGAFTDWSAMNMGIGGKLWFGTTNKVASVDFNFNFSQPINTSYSVSQLTAGFDGYMWATLNQSGNRVVRINPANPNDLYFSDYLPVIQYGSAHPYGITQSIDGNIWFTSRYSNRISKIGTGVSGSTTDADNDGLTTAQELTQGTSDNVNDTDHDGLTDYIESQWYPNRDDVFCGIECAYPDPLRQDVYLEIDWMNKPNSYSAKPTSQQLSQMTAAFTNKGIKVHTDTGEYGGGNQVPFNSPIWFTSVSAEKDFVDYKRGGDGISAQFDTTRDDIWHYMLVGGTWQYLDDNNNVVTSSSGVANASGPNLFVAYETVDDIVNQPLSGLNFDTALAGTITHELGHNLCLTGNQAYAPQPECHFEGIDNPAYTQPNYPYAGYNSAMNYAFQFTLPDYSTNPTASQYDHNDWAAIKPAEFVFYNEGANGQGGNAKAKTAKDKDRNKRIKNFKHEAAPSKYKKNNWHRKP